MAEWIITATEIYDVVSAFNKLKKLEWKQDNFHPNVGDIVYIYVTKTAELKFKCKVNETGIKKQDLKIDDREFRNYKENNEDNSTWMEIELIKSLRLQQLLVKLCRPKWIQNPCIPCRCVPRIRHRI